MKLKKINIVIILLSVVALIAYIIWSEGFTNLINVLASVKPFWMFCALALMLLYWLLEGVVLHICVKRFHRPQRFSKTMRTTMIGQFFNCVTPSASGGQPMQAFYMTRTGVPLGIAGCTLITKFIVYQTTLTIYSLVILIFKWKFFVQQVPGFSWLVLLGFVVNAAVMVGLICICCFRRFTQWAARGLVRLLAKIHLVKNKEKRLQYIDDELDKFYESVTMMKQNVGMIVQMVLLTVVQLTAYFSITYFIHLSLEPHPASYMLILAAQSFVLMISSFVPLPGAVGGAELSFYTFYQIFFSQGTLNMAMLFWRFLTFYMPILVGLFFVIPVKGKEKKEEILQGEQQESIPAASQPE